MSLNLNQEAKNTNLGASSRLAAEAVDLSASLSSSLSSEYDQTHRNDITPPF